MELFSKKIDRDDAIFYAGLTGIAAAAVAAVAIWGDKPLTISIDMRTTIGSCESDYIPSTYVTSEGLAIKALTSGEVRLAARDDAGIGTRQEQAAAKYAISNLADPNPSGSPVFPEISGSDVLCKVGQGNEERLALSPQGERIAGELQAAGVSLDFEK